jgi:hypothetical protein
MSFCAQIVISWACSGWSILGLWHIYKNSLNANVLIAQLWGVFSTISYNDCYWLVMQLLIVMVSNSHSVYDLTDKTIYLPYDFSQQPTFKVICHVFIYGFKRLRIFYLNCILRHLKPQELFFFFCVFFFFFFRKGLHPIMLL